MNPQDKELLDLYNSLSDDELIQLTDEEFSEFERLSQSSTQDTIPQSETVQTQAASFTPGTEEFQAKTTADTERSKRQQRTAKIKQFEQYWDTLPLEQKAALMMKYTGRNEPQKVYQQIAGYPHQALQAATAFALGEEEPGALDRFISGTKDVFSGAGRLGGAALDQALSPIKAMEEEGTLLESLSKRGGEQAIAPGHEQRSTIGAIGHGIGRDAMNVPLAATGVPLGRAIAKPLQAAPKGARIAAVGAGEGALDATLQELEQLQRTGEAVSPIDIGTGAVLGAAIPTVLSKVGEKVGPSLKKGAEKSLKQRLKFTPTDQMKRFAPEISNLFTNNLIPMKGGTIGIYEKLSDAVKKAADIRKRRVKEMSAQAKQKGKEMETSIDPFNEQDLKDLTIDLTSVTDQVKGELSEKVRSGSMRSERASEIMKQVDKEVSDLTKFTTGTKSALLPEQFLNRRSLWFEEGKINPQNLSDGSPASRMASNVMWEKTSPMLHGLDETISKQTSQMRDLLPLEKSLMRKLPAIENAYSMLTIGGLSGEAMRAGRNMFASNPALLARYGAGNLLESIGEGFKPSVSSLPLGVLGRAKDIAKGTIQSASLPARMGLAREVRRPIAEELRERFSPLGRGQ